MATAAVVVAAIAAVVVAVVVVAIAAATRKRGIPEPSSGHTAQGALPCAASPGAPTGSTARRKMCT